MRSAFRDILWAPGRGAHLRAAEKRLDEVLTAGLLNQIAEGERLGRPGVDETAEEHARRQAARARCAAAQDSYRALLVRRGAWVR